jgi:endonuclease-3 related protein
MPELLEVYHRLLASFGPQRWWLEEKPFEVFVGAILAHRTAWRNAARSIENLRRAGLMEPRALASSSADDVAVLIRAAGLFIGKAKSLTSVARSLVERYDGSMENLIMSGSTEELRAELLSWPGVGPETADVVMLYAANRPIFPIDLYTERLLKRLELDAGGYDGRQRTFLSKLPNDVRIYREFHALIDELGKRFCRTKPLCERCPLNDVCPSAPTSCGSICA